jgi:predicted heme/steroid binding protein/uncharacterized membrane protein
MKSFSPKDLQDHNGKNGSSALVSVQGKVYDVSSSSKWEDGTHMRRHQAGGDLTVDIKSAPHDLDVLDRVPMVGEFQPEQKDFKTVKRAKVEAFLQEHPFFRRHPHPAIVHFPLALLMVSTLFEILAITTESSETEWAAYLVLIIGVAAIPPAIATGYFTWWTNYESAESSTIRQKKKLAWLGLLWGVFAITIRTFILVNPLDFSDPLLLIYLSLVICLSAVVATIGFLGGKLTFPYE